VYTSFYEEEQVARRAQIFGSLAHVLSAYETKRIPDASSCLARGKTGGEQQRNQETHAFNHRLERAALQPRAGNADPEPASFIQHVAADSPQLFRVRVALNYGSCGSRSSGAPDCPARAAIWRRPIQARELSDRRLSSATPARARGY
jgi:hypothetical protein